jgi:hypothetical protein
VFVPGKPFQDSLIFVGKAMGLYYNILHGRLVSLLLSISFTGFDKHSSLLRNLYSTNPYFYSKGPCRGGELLPYFKILDGTENLPGKKLAYFVPLSVTKMSN